MLEFAVTVPDRELPAWVLAVDPGGERLLLAHDDQTLRWHPLADCLFAGMMAPDKPRAVIPVQPAERPHPLVVPNRATRRDIERNGA